VALNIKGQGSVTLSKGFVQRRTLNCFPSSCPRTVRSGIYATRSSRVALTEKPYGAWRFAGWRKACKGRTRTCAI